MKTEILNKLHKEEIDILNEFTKVCDNNNLIYFLAGGTLLGALRHKGFIPWDDDIDIIMPREDYDIFLKTFYKELDDKFYVDHQKFNSKYYLPFFKIRKKNTLFQEEDTINYNKCTEIFIDVFPIDYVYDIDNIESKKIKINQMMKAMLIKADVNTVCYSKPKKVLIKYLLPINNFFIEKILESKIKVKKDLKCNSQHMIVWVSRYNVKNETNDVDTFFPTSKVLFEGKEYSAPNKPEIYLKNLYGDDFMKLPPIEKRITHNPLKIMFSDGTKYEGKEL